MKPEQKRSHLEEAARESTPGTDPRWIPATSLATGLHAGEYPGLVAGFFTAMPRLPDRELAARVAPLVHRETRDVRGDAAAREPLLLRQVHSAEILDTATLDAAGASGVNGRGYDAAGHSTHTGDGAAALAERPRWLGVKTADCVPLLAVAEQGRVYAALHVGWRGAAAGIVERLLERWWGQGIGAGGVRLELGPHIGACCYEVGQDCLDTFTPTDLDGAVRGPEDGAPQGNPHLELATVIRNQARRLGVPAEHIHAHPWCTRCHDPAHDGLTFASYRGCVARGEPLTTTNLAVIGPR